MRLIDIVNAPWAVTPEMHREVQGIYARHMRGEKIDIAAIEARIGAPLPGPTKGYTVENGVAVLPLEGVLAKRMNLFMQISGGTSMQMALRSFQEAVDDPSVSAIILLIDSPGGTVDGTQELADAVFEARDKKPVLTLADGMMASAAYWIGSAASRVYMSSETAVIGSIGVVQAHVDISGAEQQRGIKTTEITAGKYKRVASQYAPLSDEGRATIQEQVDQVYSVFVEAVARNRGVNVETVLEKMADGRVFIGQQAVAAGLVDGVSTLDQLIARAAAGEFEPEAKPAAKSVADQNAGAQATVEANTQEVPMDVNKLKAEHPDVAEALIAEGRQAGAEAERARIKAVEEQLMPGHEALIAALKYDGKTTGPEAAVQVLAAEKQKKGDRLEALRKDAKAAAVPHAADDEDEEKEGEEEDEEQESKKARAFNPHLVAAKAKEYQQEQAAAGRKVGTAEAVAYVTRKMKEERRHG